MNPGGNKATNPYEKHCLPKSINVNHDWKNYIMTKSSGMSGCTISSGGLAGRSPGFCLEQSIPAKYIIEDLVLREDVDGFDLQPLACSRPL
jgi:hypothetical protein